jgi:hypothetical protein
MWGAAGIAAGLFGPCLEALYGAFYADPRTPLGGLHLGELLMFSAFSAVALTILYVAGKRKNRAVALAEEIRARKAA